MCFEIKDIKTIGVHRMLCIKTREDIEEPKVLFVAKTENNNIYFSCYEYVFDIADNEKLFPSDETFIELFNLDGFPHLCFITCDTLIKSQPFSKLLNEEVKNLKTETKNYILNLKDSEIDKIKEQINNAKNEKFTRKTRSIEKYNSCISTIVYFEEGLND